MEKKLTIEIVVKNETEESCSMAFLTLLNDIKAEIKDKAISSKKILKEGTYSFEISEKRKSKKVLENGENSCKFEILWNHFPASARFEYKGKKFTSDRVLRANRAVCFTQYRKLLEEDKVDPDVVLKCLKVQLETIKIESYKTDQNKMNYLNGFEFWLRQKKYQGFIGEEMPEEIIVSNNTIDM